MHGLQATGSFTIVDAMSQETIKVLMFSAPARSISLSV